MRYIRYAKLAKFENYQKIFHKILNLTKRVEDFDSFGSIISVVGKITLGIMKPILL